MARKCGICGKRAIFGTMLKCNSCGQYFCHRHDREQFSAITVTGMGEAPLGPYTQKNYPNGESIKSHFRCYKCRTGKEPQDMGVRKWPLSEKLFFVYFFTTSAIFLVLSGLAIAGDELGLTDGQMGHAWSLCWIHVFINLVIFIYLFMRQRRKGHIW